MLNQLWEDHKEIIITEFLNGFIIFFGFCFLYIGLISGGDLIQLFPNNPAIPQIVGVITGVGITAIFFGIGNLYTYYKDYQNDRDTKKIQNSLADLKRGIDSLHGSFFISPATPPDQAREETRTNQVEKIKLELKFEMAFLKAIGVCLAFFTATVGFIGFDTHGKQYLDTTIVGFPSISLGLMLLCLLAFSFLLLLFRLLCEYHSKMAEIGQIYNN
jgi:hypothetical protein